MRLLLWLSVALGYTIGLAISFGSCLLIGAFASTPFLWLCGASNIRATAIDMGYIVGGFAALVSVIMIALDVRKKKRVEV